MIKLLWSQPTSGRIQHMSVRAHGKVSDIPRMGRTELHGKDPKASNTLVYGCSQALTEETKAEIAKVANGIDGIKRLAFGPSSAPGQFTLTCGKGFEPANVHSRFIGGLRAAMNRIDQSKADLTRAAMAVHSSNNDH